MKIKKTVILLSLLVLLLSNCATKNYHWALTKVYWTDLHDKKLKEEVLPSGVPVRAWAKAKKKRGIGSGSIGDVVAIKLVFEGIEGRRFKGGFDTLQFEIKLGKDGKGYHDLVIEYEWSSPSDNEIPKIKEIIMDSIKTHSLCVLYETEDCIAYLTRLERIVQNAGDELKSYAGGDDLFLRYEIWTICNEMPNDQSIAILHSQPERIAMVDGGSYDTSVYEILYELPFLECGWINQGLCSDSDNSILAQIEEYYHNHRNKTPVVVENLRKYDR